MTSTTPPVSEGASGRAPDGTAFELRGEPRAPPVVLIHGLGLCRRLWDAHLPAFNARHRVIAYDLYGHGESAPPPAEASLTIYSEQILRLLDHVGAERAALVGFSIGGMINRRFALDHRDRLSALVILNSPHERGAEAQDAVEARAKAVREGGNLATLDSALARWFTPAFREARPDVMAAVRAWREAANGESYAQCAWVLAHGVRELIAPAPPVAAPTLVMTAENDTGSTPAMSHAIAAEIEGAETIIVPALQHLGLMERPEAFTSPVLDFLRRRG